MKKLIVANWKMNTPRLSEWRKFRAPRNVDVVICPPFTEVSRVRSQVSGVKIGAQNCFWENYGAYTGEVSPAMLKSSGVEYVIIGHSERRIWLGETDEMVNKKVLAALRSGLKVILCVGEPIEVRKRGTTVVLRYLRRQIAHAVKNVPKSNRGHIVVAYEPIWAISTSGIGVPCPPYEAERMVHACAAELALKENFRDVRGIYGGSVNARDAKSYFQMEYIDGALVGGASLKAADFRKIVEAASKVE